jgi:hypothetical protein
MGEILGCCEKYLEIRWFSGGATSSRIRGFNGQILEFCLNKWNTWGAGDDDTPYAYPALNAGTYRGWANVATNFDWSDRAGLYGSSAHTAVGSGFVGQSAVFAASISGGQLQNSINAVNTVIENNVLKGQIQVPYSTDPTKYALVGLEDGHEMWSGMTTLGGYSNQLQVFTAN